MINLFFGFGIIFLLICIVSVLLWSKVQFSWLSKLCTILVLSLPFEYFPRVELGGASWRISQVLVLFGFWIIAILAIKKDSILLSHKLHFASIYPLVFFFLSSPSWFLVQDFQRFIVHVVGTIFVFGAFILLINFASDIWKNLQRLALVLFGCAVFGLYQFFGDLVGISPTFTLLREHYTKVVFGVPRVQGTAVEPLYFAGMLLIAIFVLIFWICDRLESVKRIDQAVILSREEVGSSLPNEASLRQAKDRIPLENIHQKCNCELVSEPIAIQPSSNAPLAITTNLTPVSLETASPYARGNFTQFVLNLPQWIFGTAQDDSRSFALKYLFPILFIVFAVFVLTISKGTFGVLAILTLPLVAVIYFSFDFAKYFVHKYIMQTVLLAILGLGLLLTFVNPIALLGEVGTNFVETLSGTSASAVERSMFVNEAIIGIKQNPFFGIGHGQFGEFAGGNLGSINEDGKAIVNNVYFEIWLEQGILAFFFFLFFLFQPVFLLLKSLATRWSPLQSNILAALSLIFILVGYYVQWTLFSPIFIMPIFIMLGLAYNLISNQD